SSRSWCCAGTPIGPQRPSVDTSAIRSPATISRSSASPAAKSRAPRRSRSASSIPRIAGPCTRRSTARSSSRRCTIAFRTYSTTCGSSFPKIRTGCDGRAPVLSATKRHLAVLGLALPALGGCGAKDLDPPPLPEMPPLRAPVAAVDPSATAEPAHLAEQRQSDAVMTMDACLRRSRARLDHAWARLLVDLDRESGVLLRDRRDVQPWVPAVRGDLIACHDPDAL